MSTVMAQILPSCEMVVPSDEATLAEAIRQAAANKRPVYPVGGGTRLAYGGLPELPGIELHTTGLKRIIDHAADDMTVTVEAGVTLAQLANVLESRRQRLPIDVPQPALATVGGLIATNTFGPRRFGFRTIRDYLIGLRAVDGRGEPFAGGGRVVKNAAGYDTPRLLVGSMGTLGVITQVSLMVRPAAEMTAMVSAKVPDFETADLLLSRLMQSAVRPVSVDWLNRGWDADTEPALGSDGGVARLLVGFEGSRSEVEWMVEQLRGEWQESTARDVRILDSMDTEGMWQWMTELPAHLQANVLPSRIGPLMRQMLEIDPACAIAAHAGDGVAKVRLSEEVVRDLPAVLESRFRLAVEELGGNLVLLSVVPGSGLTRNDIWGPDRESLPILKAIKERFDPEGILNPGRWLF